MEEEKQEEKEESKEQPDYFKALEELKKEKQALLDDMREAAKVRDELAQLRAKELLGGHTESGEPQPEKKEETAKEYVDRIMKGG